VKTLVIAAANRRNAPALPGGISKSAREEKKKKKKKNQPPAQLF
jgi:hypothetical protein